MTRGSWIKTLSGMGSSVASVGDELVIGRGGRQTLMGLDVLRRGPRLLMRLHGVFLR
jgi:hypothetical protein